VHCSRSSTLAERDLRDNAQVKILVAPDKFKGSLTALEVASSLRRGMLAAEPSVDCVLLPLADGGDGSIDAAITAGFRSVELTVDGPTGVPHPTNFAFDGETAVVEVASTCGLAALPDGRLEPLRSSSYGVGQAIRAALELRPNRIVVALGGSASTDGGIGMLAALGVRFTGADGAALRVDGSTLGSIEGIDTSAIVDFRGATILAVSDVTNPLTGAAGAAAVFGPQKGATPVEVTRLDEGLLALVDCAGRSGFPGASALATTPGAGSAGGVGFGCLLLGGTIVSGADFFLDLLGFDERLLGCDLVVTGEGSLDDQTASGKLVARVAERSSPIAVVAVAGRLSIDASGLEALGISRAIALSQLTSEPTAGDPALTGRLLEEIGRMIVDERGAELN
jgi:glycerate kinase